MLFFNVFKFLSIYYFLEENLKEETQLKNTKKYYYFKII